MVLLSREKARKLAAGQERVRAENGIFGDILDSLKQATASVFSMLVKLEHKTRKSLRCDTLVALESF